MSKTLAGLGLALAVWVGAGCGGSQKSSTNNPPPTAPVASPCVAMASHMAGVLRDMGLKQGSHLMTEAAPILDRVAAERCQADKWSEAVITCASAATEETMDGCVEQLDDAQQEALEEQLDKEMSTLKQDESFDEGGGGGPGAPAGSPPPPPDDPCGGGA